MYKSTLYEIVANNDCQHITSQLRSCPMSNQLID